MTTHRTTGLTIACVAAGMTTLAATAAPRDVQFVHVDVQSAIVELRNLGAEAEPLAGFRLCTADGNEMFKYTAVAGFGARSLDPGASVWIHFNNDAPVDDPDAIDVISLGGMTAGPMTAGPYGLAIYTGGPFTTPANMIDYMQWTDALDNPGNLSADARAPVALGAVLWSGLADWIVTEKSTTAIVLLDESGGTAHGPDDYELVGGTSCPTDIDMSGETGFTDLLAVLAAWGPCDGGEPGCVGDLDMSGDVGFTDLLAVLAGWGPCE